MKFKDWVIKENNCDYNKLKSQEITELSAKVLSARGYSNLSDAEKYLFCDVSELHNPFLMKDVDKAVERIKLACIRKEKICVYGDYDVDGITAVCLLTSFLQAKKADVFDFVPNRMNEGYSLNCMTLDKFANMGIKLIITVDCGITNIREIAYAKTLGIDVIVTDHHSCKTELPSAIAIIDPLQPDCNYPFKKLAGVGVALKLVLALSDESERMQVLLSYVDFVALGTIADVMDLNGENRILTSLGISKLKATDRAGLRTLLQITNITPKNLNAATISYIISPRLNAAGRMGCPELALSLLMCDNDDDALKYAVDLCEMNKKRQELEREIYNQCISVIENRTNKHDKIIILAGENWHQGVIGIVASKLLERYKIPIFMICIEDNQGKGSCRSLPDFNLFNALEQCSDILENFGGHQQAAGFTISIDNILEFRKRLVQIANQYTVSNIQDCANYHKSNLEIDVELNNADLLDRYNVESLERLEPYGAGNSQPRFLLRSMKILNYSCVGGGRHTRFQLESTGKVFDAIFFSCSQKNIGLQIGSYIDVVFYPIINEYRGVQELQLQIIDIRRSINSMQNELLIYQRYMSGIKLPRYELKKLIPEERYFLAVRDFLKYYKLSTTIIDNPVILSKKIANFRRLPQNCASTMMCIEILREHGLLDVQLSNKRIKITISHRLDNLDVTQLEIFKRLQKLLEN